VILTTRALFQLLVENALKRPTGPGCGHSPRTQKVGTNHFASIFDVQVSASGPQTSCSEVHRGFLQFPQTNRSVLY